MIATQQLQFLLSTLCARVPIIDYMPHSIKTPNPIKKKSNSHFLRAMPRALMFLLALVLLTIIVFALLKYLSYDNLDRYCLRELLKKSLFFLTKKGSNNKHIFLGCLFGRPELFGILTEGGCYNGLYLSNDDSLKYNNKLYWDRFFTKYNIRHPKTYTTCVNGRLEGSPRYPALFKPLNGGFGNGIKVVNAASECGPGDAWLTQTLLRDCDYPHARHYRVVTFPGSVYCLYRFDGAQSEIASNHAKGGRVELVFWNGTTYKQFPPVLLGTIAQDLAQAHMLELPDSFSIGWDVIVHCEGNTKVPYALEGNFMHSVWFDMDDATKTTAAKSELMRDYRQKAVEFHKRKGLI